MRGDTPSITSCGNRRSMPHRVARVLLLSVLAGMLLAGCGASRRQQTAILLDRVDALLDEHPDSALAMLEGVDSSALSSRSLRARYYLLKGIALDKSYVDDGSFLPEMDASAEWFALHGSISERTLAYYYLADQQWDAGETAKASVNFSNALQLAEEGSDWSLGGMAARNLSDIYMSGYDYARSLEYARKAVRMFVRANKPAHILHAKVLLAGAYYNNGLSGDCLQLCDSLRAEASATGNDGILADALSTAALIYVRQEPPQTDSTIALLTRITTLYPLSAQQQAILAWATCIKGDKKSAKTMISSAYDRSHTTIDSLRVYPWDAQIARLSGETERYAELQEAIVKKTDESIRNTILHSVDLAQTQYHQKQELLLKQKMRKNRIYTAGVSAFGILLLGFFLILARMRRIRLEEKNRANQALSAKLVLYGTTVEETLDFSFGVLNKLSDAYYHPNTSQPGVFRTILQDYYSDVSSRQRLGDAIEQNINIIHDDVISRLRAEVPALKEKDIKLFALYLFGFSYKALSQFDAEYTSLNTSYSRIFRLRKTIAESGSAYAEFFLSFLERRPTNGRADVQKN